jgi:hypothetical protein
MDYNKIKSRFFSLNYFILYTLVFFLFGSLTELYLIKHYEDTTQIIPIFCIGLSLACLIILYFRVSKFTIVLFKLSLFAISLAGLMGVVLHLKSNYEFEKEMEPTSNTLDVFIESLSGALPALAPLNLVILAMVGYSYILIINQNQ